MELEHLYSEMCSNTNFVCDLCHSSRNHFLYTCTACACKTCCSCVHTKSFCSCNRSFNDNTQVLENQFFSTFSNHSCKIQSISQQRLTHMVRENLIESGTFRSEQVFTKKLIDHLTGYYSSSQSQLIVNLLVRMTNQHGIKIEKAFSAFDIANLNLIRHFANVTKNHVLIDQSLGDKQKDFFVLYNNLPKNSPTWKTICLEALKPSLNVFFFVLVLVLFSIFPATNANSAFVDLGTTQTSTKVLYENFSISINDNHPKGYVIRFKEVTLRWLHEHYLRKVSTSTLGRNLEFKTNFCTTREIDILSITNALKTRQNLYNLYENFSSIPYYYSCHSAFQHSNLAEIDQAISLGLNQFHQTCYGGAPCNVNLNLTLGLSLYSHKQKVRKIFFQVEGKQTCKLHICTHLGKGSVVVHIIEHIRIGKERRVTNYCIWGFFGAFLLFLVLAPSFMIYLQL